MLHPSRGWLFPTLPLLLFCALLAITWIGAPGSGASNNTTFTVSIEQPEEGATVNGTVQVEGTASGSEQNISHVEVRIDDGPWQAATGTQNWSYAWDTTEQQDGEHTLSARGHDEGGNTSSVDQRNVTVENQAQEEPPPPPQASIEQPNEGATVDGTVTVEGTASSEQSDIAQVRIQIDDGAWNEAEGQEAWSYAWDTTQHEDGEHTLTVEAEDADGRTGTDQRNVTVHNEDETNDEDANQDPSVTIDRPADGSTVHGTITLEGRTWDDGHVVRVDVQTPDGSWQQADGVTTWSFVWDTTTVTNETHSLQARAIDDEGAVNTAWVNLAVDQSQADGAHDDDANETGNHEPPQLDVTIPQPGESIRDELLIAGTAEAANAELSHLLFQINDEEAFTLQASPSWTHRVDTSTLPEGTHVLTVRLVAEGNASTTVQRVFHVDRSDEQLDPLDVDVAPPNLLLSQPTDGAAFETTLRIEGIVVDPEEANTVNVTYRINEGEWETFQVEPGERFHEEVPLDGLSPGEHTFTIHVSEGDRTSDAETQAFTMRDAPVETQGSPTAVALLVTLALAGVGLAWWARHDSSV